MKKEVFTKGKKKEAIARAVLKKGKGKVKINKQPIDLYTPDVARRMINEPLNIAKEILGEDKMNKIDIHVNVKGGGKTGQTLASRTSIGKALAEWSDSEQLNRKFMQYDRSLLIDDYRRKEPKKPLRKGARAKPTKSYR